MNSKTIFAMLGIAVIATATLGLGAAISTSSLNRIGGDNNVVVPGADADVTEVIWTETANKITSATVKVKNTDTSAHTYEICVITKAGASFSDTAGTGADCASTGSIAASTEGTATIAFSIPLAAADVDNTNISIEQTA